jgi:large subunit ribosomal protein L25
MEVNDTIVAKHREAGSKGHARKLRAAGMAPAVAYGPADKPRYLAIEPRMFVEQRRKYGRGHIYTVDLEGTTFKALIKDISQHPITHKVEHVDLYAVDPKRPMRVSVRIDLKGKAKGIIEGGILSQVLRRAEIRGLLDVLPEFIEVDISHLGVGDSVHMSDIKLPEGVKFTALQDEAVAVLTAPDGGVEPATAADETAAPAEEDKK